MVKKISTEEMEKYEKLFEEFYNKIKPISNRITSFFSDPIIAPHSLSDELLQQMELLHMKLSMDLYRIRYGEYLEQLRLREIDFDRFEQLTKELSDINKLYI